MRKTAVVTKSTIYAKSTKNVGKLIKLSNKTPKKIIKKKKKFPTFRPICISENEFFCVVKIPIIGKNDDNEITDIYQ